MVQHLARVLPPEYYAAPQIYLGGGVEIDIGTFERDEVGDSYSSAGERSTTATALWTGAEPTLRAESDVPQFDEYEVRVYDVRRERRLVAVVELVPIWLAETLAVSVDLETTYEEACRVLRIA